MRAHEQSAERHLAAAARWEEHGAAELADLERRCATLETDWAQLAADQADLEQLRDSWVGRPSEAARAEIERRSADISRRTEHLGARGVELVQERARLRDERERALEERERAVARREWIADERDRLAEERDLIANHREDLANERERLADEREGTAEQRELERVTRVEAGQARERASAAREEAAVQREMAVSEREHGGDTGPAESDPVSHHQRPAAESFGSDPERYDRARPRYPDALIKRIVAAAPGGLVLDVGVGTGIVARQFQAAGCQVLGVEPDARLAEFARRSGVEVEVSSFEAWEAAGRKFDAVVSGETWHWVNPVAGAAKAAEVLQPGGRLAVFWNTGNPPASLDEAFAEVYRRVLPQSLVARLGRSSIEEAHRTMCANAAGGMRASGAFDQPEEWWFEWVQSYTRDEWLDALQTSGGVIPKSQLADLLEGVGDAIDAAGGSFTMNYITFAVTAVRRS